MKVIIAGSRDIMNMDLVKQSIVNSRFHITEVVCGMARGVDSLGKQWAEENGIPVKEFPTNWDKYHKAAGAIRNMEMAKYADALIAIMKDGSKGTKNMIQCATKVGMKNVYITLLKGE